MREFSVPAAATVAGTANLTDPVWANAETAPDTVQFVRNTPAGRREVTCRDFRDDVLALARGLIAAGIQPGARVGLLSRTRYEWTVVDYAIWSCGATTVPIYDTSSADQIRWILADSGAVACVVETAANQATVDGVRPDAPDLADVWQIDRGDLDRLAAQGAAVEEAEVRRRCEAIRADDTATIVYTSGTTGRPKGCVLSHRNLCSNVANAIPGLPHLFREGASTLLFLPLAHAFARLIQLGIVQTRTRMAHLPDMRNLVDELKEFRPTFLLCIPRVFEKAYTNAQQQAQSQGRGAFFRRAEAAAIAYSEALDAGRPGLPLRLRHAFYDRLVYAKVRAGFGGQCTAAIAGGAPLGPRLAHFFRGAGLTVYEGYGLTETSPAVAVNLERQIRIGTVGRPLPGASVRIADDGEILIKGELVFRGYWKNPEQTAEAIDPDGWFHSGDLGELDDDGYLRITGRKKEIIVTASGKNLAPAELEDKLRGHPLISQAMVVGDRQPFVAALITINREAWGDWLARHGKPADADVADLREDSDLRAEIQQVVDDANQTVSRAEQIKRFTILSDDFTEANDLLTPTLKIKRDLIQKEYADEIATLYR